MNSRQNKQAQALAALSPEDRARLERLAAQTPLTPDELWPEVWQYGFDDADLEADEYFKTKSGIANAEVMAEARRMVWLLLGRNDDHQDK